jgi:ketosteroid isomerase-like protein
LKRGKLLWLLLLGINCSILAQIDNKKFIQAAKMTHTELITNFYTAFSKGKAEEMVACYHKDIQFEDPAFGVLHGEDAKNMWRMLIARGGSIDIQFSDVQADGEKGSANWVATYAFSQTGRTVVNKIHANFLFKEGKIIQHTDTFNLHHWAKQAFGWKGWLLGGTSFFKKKLNAQTAATLRRFVEKQK